MELKNNFELSLQEESEASHSKIVLIGLIDAAFAIASVVFVVMNQTPAVLYNLISSVNPTVLVFIWFIIYRFIMISFFKGTLGMKIFHAKFLNGSLQPLTNKEKILASFFVLHKGVGYYNR